MSADQETTYDRPESVPAVHRRLDRAGGDVTVVAGGQTLSLLLRQGLVETDGLVDIGGIPELSGIDLDEGTATLGATTTYRELSRHDLSDRATVLGDACSVIADRQVRTMGTVGGALCHGDPALDIVAALRVLDATLRVGSVGGRRTVPLGEFQVGHMRTDRRENELLERISLDVPGPETGTAYEKHAAVEAGWATVGAATWVTVEEGTITEARVALTAVGDTALRAPSVEATLTGAGLDTETLSAASDAVGEVIDPIADRAGSAAYKRAVAPTVVERSLRAAVRRAGGSL